MIFFEIQYKYKYLYTYNHSSALADRASASYFCRWLVFLPAGRCRQHVQAHSFRESGGAARSGPLISLVSSSFPSVATELDTGRSASVGLRTARVISWILVYMRVLASSTFSLSKSSLTKFYHTPDTMDVMTNWAVLNRSCLGRHDGPGLDPSMARYRLRASLPPQSTGQAVLQPGRLTGPISSAIAWSCSWMSSQPHLFPNFAAPSPTISPTWPHLGHSTLPIHGAPNPKTPPTPRPRLPVPGAATASAAPPPPPAPPPRGGRCLATRRRGRLLGADQRVQAPGPTARGRRAGCEGDGPRHARESLRRRRAQRAPAPAGAARRAEGVHGAPRGVAA
jgi:hypothetical protein